MTSRVPRRRFSRQAYRRPWQRGWSGVNEANPLRGLAGLLAGPGGAGLTASEFGGVGVVCGACPQHPSDRELDEEHRWDEDEVGRRHDSVRAATTRGDLRCEVGQFPLDAA